MLMAGRANAVTTFFGHGVGAIAMQDAQSELVLVRESATLAMNACSSAPSSDHLAKTL